MSPELGIGCRDDRVGQRLGQVLRIGLAERNVAAWRIIGGKREQHMLARTIKDLRGLEQQAIGWIEQGWEKLYRRQVAREVHVGKGGKDDKRRRDQRKDHPQAEEGVARAG